MMTNGEPKKEKAKLSTETITGQDLKKIIFRRDGRPDPRFIPLDEKDPYSGEPITTGVFYYSPIDVFSNIGRQGSFYSLLKVNKKIIGLASLEQSPRDGEEDILWVQSVCIDETLKGQRKGFADKLLREIFSFAKSNNKKLSLSKFTEEGAERLKAKYLPLSVEYSVEIVNLERLD